MAGHIGAAYTRAPCLPPPPCLPLSPPMLPPEDIATIEGRLAGLRLEHRDLDDVILRLNQSPVQDQLQLQRLKKRKLLVKDQIALLERQLTPDIPA